MPKNILVAQSGGPTSAINATLAGILRQAQISPNIHHIFGARNGIEGVLAENIILLDALAQNIEQLTLLEQTPAAILGSCRYRLPEFSDNPQIYHTIAAIFKRYNIGCFLYIGGNDSMDTVMKLSEYFQQQHSNVNIFGVPKTIDNDLYGTDHTPGFGSAAKYIATTIREIKSDCEVYQKPSVTIVEIMGRNAGWLTASSALSRANGCQGPQLIYLPEVRFSLEHFIQDVQEQLKKQPSVLIAVSEGIKDIEGKYIAEYAHAKNTDVFGNQQLSGAAAILANVVTQTLNCKARAIELNLPQRCSGHLQSATDIDEAKTLGAFAVSLALAGKSGEMACIHRDSNEPYLVNYTSSPIKDIANKEKTVPTEWIDINKKDITPQLYSYLYPLIQGERLIKYKNGIPEYLPSI